MNTVPLRKRKKNQGYNIIFFIKDVVYATGESGTVKEGLLLFQYQLVRTRQEHLEGQLPSD